MMASLIKKHVTTQKELKRLTRQNMLTGMVEKCDEVANFISFACSDKVPKLHYTGSKCIVCRHSMDIYLSKQQVFLSPL